MSYFNTSGNWSDNSLSSLRSSDGKVLGRVRMEVKGSTPQAGMKDYRFFVDPVSSLPPYFSESLKYGFTGFMSRIGLGFNAFDNDEEALRYLQSEWGDFFVTFTPAMRNNKFFVLDDLQKESPVSYPEQNAAYLPLPAFGQVGAPVFGGDINKFCRHILTGKPIPGLSKKYWNSMFTPHAVIAYTDNFDGRLGDAILFAPLEGNAFDKEVISEGGAYFSTENSGRIGYKVLHFSDDSLESHVVRCRHSPLWFVSEDSLGDLISDIQELPNDGDVLSLYGIKFDESVVIDNIGHTESDEDNENLEGVSDVLDDTPVFESFDNAENIFLDRLSLLAKAKGLLYHERDLLNFHISVKSARLTILAGLSGMGKSQLVRLYGEALGLPPERVLMVPVRPSWMDDSDILGYADTTQMVYRAADTGISELLLDAEKHQDKLYMICFDEMNLARAEHYFAQFISVLEKEGTPRIRLYNPTLQGRLYNGQVYPAEISIGKNVIFVGTVNVDESTYPFSDKILDRANVLTLHRERFSAWRCGEIDKVPEIEEISASVFDTFRVYGNLELTDRELAFLDDLNRAFEESHIQCGIGFRVARQIDAYLKNIPTDYDFDREEGLDCQMVQRILTKLRGSSQQLHALIHVSDQGEAEGSLLQVFDRYKDLSDFIESRKLLSLKAQELKLYDYTI